MVEDEFITYAVNHGHLDRKPLIKRANSDRVKTCPFCNKAPTLWEDSIKTRGYTIIACQTKGNCPNPSTTGYGEEFVFNKWNNRG